MSQSIIEDGTKIVVPCHGITKKYDFVHGCIYVFYLFSASGISLLIPVAIANMFNNVVGLLSFPALFGGCLYLIIKNYDWLVLKASKRKSVIFQEFISRIYSILNVSDMKKQQLFQAIRLVPTEKIQSWMWERSGKENLKLM